MPTSVVKILDVVEKVVPIRVGLECDIVISLKQRLKKELVFDSLFLFLC